jgi:hypothetical protein
MRAHGPEEKRSFVDPSHAKRLVGTISCILALTSARVGVSLPMRVYLKCRRTMQQQSRPHRVALLQQQLGERGPYSADAARRACDQNWSCHMSIRHCDRAIARAPATVSGATLTRIWAQ